MANQEAIQHSFKRDRYVNARGGNSRFLNIYCSRCKQHIALYQKDGHGRLLRMYLDRIFEPRELSCLQSTASSKAEVPNLKCPKCGTLIGTPMVYEAEKRLALRLIYGSFIQEKSDGVYPPVQRTDTVNESEKGDSNEKQDQASNYS